MNGGDTVGNGAPPTGVTEFASRSGDKVSTISTFEASPAALEKLIV
jgi:hypothetical protein